MIKKRLVKKTTAIAITGALTIAMAASAIAAPGGFGGNGGPGGRGPSQEMQQGGGPQGPGGGEFNPGDGQEGEASTDQMPEMSGGEAPTGRMPEMPDGEASTGQMPEMSGGEAPTGQMPEMSGSEAPTGQMPEMSDGEAPTGRMPEMPSGEAPTGQMPEMPGSEAPTGRMPKMQDGEASTGQMPEMPGGQGNRGGRPENGMRGLNTDNIKTSIEGLEDEDTKANLEALLSDYESAKTALETAIKEKSDDVDTYKEAEKEAMEELNTALKEAGIDTRPKLPEGKDMKPGAGMKGFDTEAVRTAIDALEDGDVKTDLATLLSDYEAAKTALDTAVDEGSEDTDTYREAEMKAMEELRSALEEAGIDTRPRLPEGSENGNSGMGQRPETPSDDGSTDKSEEKPAEKPAAQPGMNVDNGNNNSSDNIFTRFGNWFMSLFAR